MAAGPFRRITATPAYERVADAIEREILSGRIRIGDCIGTETELGQQFGVNRSTVREGIRLLERSGLLVRDSSRRLRVAEPDYQELARGVSRAMLLYRVSVRELCEAALATEPAAAELAAVRADDRALAALASNLSDTAAALDDPPRLAALDFEFHALVADVGGNRILQLAREPMSRLALKATEVLYERSPQAPVQLLEQHSRVYAAIRGLDAEQARLEMRAHIRSFRRGCEQAKLDLEGPVDWLYLEQGREPAAAETPVEADRIIR